MSERGIHAIPDSCPSDIKENSYCDVPVSEGVFYAEGDSIESALCLLKEKFLCYLHDENIEIEIISVNFRKPEAKEQEGLYNVEKNG